jgi:uncharacterized protein (DUF885 family)
MGGALLLPTLPGDAPAAESATPRLSPVLATLFDRLHAERAAGTADPAVQLDRLRGVPAAGLGPQDRLDLAHVLDAVGREVALRRVWPHGAPANRPSPYTVSPQAGTWRNAAALAKGGGADTTLAATLAATLDGETERLQAEAAAGVVLPAPILAALIDRMASLSLSLPGPAGTALDRQRTVLAGMVPRAPAAPGLHHLPGGGDGYAAMLSVAATVDITPDQAHALARDLADRFTAEAEPLFRRLGLAGGTSGERFRRLAQQPDQALAEDEGGRAAAVAAMNAHLTALRPRLPAVFGRMTRAPITIRALTTAELAAGRQGFRQDPGFGADRPGGYVVDLSRMAERPRFALPTMTDHETLPGHLIQAAWSEEAGLHPFRARFQSGAVLEGWSTYAQTLVVEMGVYDDDPAARLGYCQSVLFRAARMLADTGLHARGWSREQAIRTITDLGGEPERVAAAEVDRMSVLPGFLTGHMVGYAQMLRLRDRAQAAQGTRFSLARFHDAVLSPGPLPFAVLDQQVPT